MYCIQRFYRRENLASRILKTGLTLEQAQAQAHCRNPETSSKTCEKFEGINRTRICGEWFEGFEEQ